MLQSLSPRIDPPRSTNISRQAPIGELNPRLTPVWEAVASMTFEEASQRLIRLARDHGGVVTAAQVERDGELSRDIELVSAAARALDGSTNVFGTPRAPAEGGWFPFEELRFTALPSAS